jgi:hypothetical protein
MNIAAKLTLATVVVLSASTAAFAQQAHWSQQGDYYASGNTIVQQATPQELNQFREGDYYAPGKTTVQQPTRSELNQFDEGDYYAPTK